MKKHILIILGLFLTVFLSAQEHLKFGVFIDPQICWFSPDARTVKSEGTTFGINGGLVMDKYFAKNYAFSTAIGIGTQGGKLLYDEGLNLQVYDKVDSLPAGTTVEYNLQYITVPLGLKLKSNQMGYTTLFVNIGLTNQVNVKAKATSDNNNGLEDDSIKDEIGIYNLSYHFGAGFEYALGEDTALTIGALYHNGFLDVTKASSVVNSRVISIRLGILF
ncbi:MAG: PorT family protein [Bacteroidales bacterium]|nr:PorT family protein [Bacteroidales bacterium]MBN2819217.1 PorT family protein [Bacteroidales bacterium]